MRVMRRTRQSASPKLQPLAQLFALLLVARLAEQREHILLVGFHAGLIERIDPERITAHAAGLLEEIEQRSQIILVELGQLDPDIGHAPVDIVPISAMRFTSPMRLPAR